MEALEDVRQLFGWDAGAGVLDGEHGVAAGGLQRHGYGSVQGEFQGV